MMKKIMFPSLIVIISMLSIFCSKKSDDGGTTSPIIPTNGWNLGSTSYTTVDCQKYVNGLRARTYSRTVSNADTAQIFIAFNVFPTVSGTYSIIDFTTTSALSFGSIGIRVSDNSGMVDFKSKPLTPTNATITVTNNKVTVVIPAVNVVRNTATGTSSSTLTATLIEQ